MLKPAEPKMMGTNEERDSARNAMWSYFYDFGVPTLFVTLNPYDVGSLELRHFMNLPSGIQVPTSEMYESLISRFAN